MRKQMFLVVLLALASPRTTAQNSKPTPQDASMFYKGSWETGEIKTCWIKAEWPRLVLCDEPEDSLYWAHLDEKCWLDQPTGDDKANVVARCTKIVSDELRKQVKEFKVTFLKESTGKVFTGDPSWTGGDPWAGSHDDFVRRFLTDLYPKWKCTKEQEVRCTWINPADK